MAAGNFNWPPPPSTPKDAPWTDAQKIQAYLYAILQALTSPPSGPGASGPSGPTGVTGATLNDVVNVLNQILAIQSNASAIQTLDVPVTTPNQQIQFTAMTVPDGFPLTVISHPNNNAAGLILVAPKNGSLQYNVVSLKPGQFVQYKVHSSDALYIVGTVVGDIVILSSELKP
jgi:hypothetical protein